MPEREARAMRSFSCQNADCVHTFKQRYICMSQQIAGGRVLKREAHAEGGIENGYNIQADISAATPPRGW